MAIPVDELLDWLHSLPKDAEVGINEEGMALTVRGSDEFLEIGCTFGSEDRRAEMLRDPEFLERRFTLDGKLIDMREYLMVNDFGWDELGEIRTLGLANTMRFGGGAQPVWVLARVR